mgnify:FL=1|tara:strand:+ start:83 stop:322 length:240 start_codon:yes stop_codon:yes gene_type:complete
MYKIEKNIPIEEYCKTYAFDEVLYNMGVGDSIEVKSVKESRAFYQRMYYLKKYKKLSKDYKIDIRTISPDVSYRIWRTK